MWIRVGSFQAKPGEVALLKSTYDERAVPKVRATPGNLACLLLAPVAEGDPFMAITIWETKAAAEQYESSGAAKEVVAMVREFFAGPPRLASYESDSTAGLGPLAK